jgi:hypothetical protein
MRPSRTPTHVFMDVWLERVRLCLLGIGNLGSGSRENEIHAARRWSLTPTRDGLWLRRKITFQFWQSKCVLEFAGINAIWWTYYIMGSKKTRLKESLCYIESKIRFCLIYFLFELRFLFIFRLGEIYLF